MFSRINRLNRLNSFLLRSSNRYNPTLKSFRIQKSENIQFYSNNNKKNVVDESSNVILNQPPKPIATPLYNPKIELDENKNTHLHLVCKAGMIESMWR
jgi:hypothetical protein